MFLAMFGEQTSQHKLAIFLDILKNFIEFWGERRPLPNEKEKHLELKNTREHKRLIFFVKSVNDPSYPCLYSDSRKPKRSCRRRKQEPGRQIQRGRSAHGSDCEKRLAEEENYGCGSFLVNCPT